MVKVAVTSQPPGGLDALVDPRFGRAFTFTIVELEGNSIGEVEVVDNPAANAFGGAGPAAAQFIANMQVKAIITGNIGPNAFAALSSLGIEVYLAPLGITVRDAIQKYISREL
nr:NifB/NifX family molybdenum-iron cluster-binding protein [Candidatus Freyrarchaeum guaymaensis]